MTQEEKQWKPVPKVKPTGVLKELLDNIDEKELEETRKEMMEEAEKEESVSKDLEEEIERYVNTPANQGNPDLKKELSECARHFARWQEQQDEKDTSGMLIVAYLRGGDEGKKIMLNKACEWLEENLTNYWGQLFANYYGQISANDTEQFIKNFRKAMEE